MEISDLRVTFEPSEVEKRVTIHTIEDRVVEGQEEFTAVLRPVSDRLSIAADTLHINVEESTDGNYNSTRHHCSFWYIEVTTNYYSGTSDKIDKLSIYKGHVVAP